MARGKAKEKQIEKQKLRELKSLTFTMRADEATLQRVAALLMFADHMKPQEEYIPQLLPWEDPDDPRFEKPPEIQIDYEVVRREITTLLSAYLQKHGEEKTIALVESFGSRRLKDIPEPQLKGLYDALAAEAASE